MGRCPKYDLNLMRKGDSMKIPGNASQVYAILRHWRKRHNMTFDVQLREGNTLLRDDRGRRYAIVTVTKAIEGKR